MQQEMAARPLGGRAIFVRANNAVRPNIFAVECQVLALPEGIPQTATKASNLKDSKGVEP